MSKKTLTKETPMEDVSESSISVRRSSRISSNQNGVGSPIVKTITTRRTSATSVTEKGKDVNGDADNTSPVIEKRRTRRTSTDSDFNPTPIKNRRGSKLIEEEKKIGSSPGTPSRKNTRSASRSPSNISDIPARRTRRSSQDTEPVEQQPARRSTRRRASADTQEEAAKEEIPEQTKPVTRRRRSSSIDEPENAKTETKPKTKRLFSEDNQLEPIHERDVEQKVDTPKVGTSENKTVHELSIIEEIEDGDVEESDKLIKDIDEVLGDEKTLPEPKSVSESKYPGSIFSPLTSKVQKAKSPAKVTEIVKQNVKIIEENKDSPKTVQDSDETSSNTTTEQKSLESHEAFKKKRESVGKKDNDECTEKVNSPEKSASITRKSAEYRKFISDGSDDSFTLKLNMSLDKTNSKEDQSNEDEVFSSPGSNKENSSVNIPTKNTSRNSLNQNKEIMGSPILSHKTTSKHSFHEAMEVDEDELENVQDSGKLEDSKQEKSVDLTSEEPKSLPDVETIIIVDSLSNSPKRAETENVSLNNSFAQINSSQSDNLNSTSNSMISPEKSILDKKNISSKSINYEDDKDGSSSDFSIKLIDSDEEEVEVLEKTKTPLKTETVKRSKRPRMSDGTSKTILQRLQQNVEEVEQISENQEVDFHENSTLDSSQVPSEDEDKEKEEDTEDKNKSTLELNSSDKEPEVEEDKLDKSTEESLNTSKAKNPKKIKPKENYGLKFNPRLVLAGDMEHVGLDHLIEKSTYCKVNPVGKNESSSEANTSQEKSIDENLTSNENPKKESSASQIKGNEEVNTEICNKSSTSNDKKDSLPDESTHKITEKESSQQLEDQISPLKSKMKKMKDCGVNFLNPSPVKSKVKLDEEINSKIDEFLSKKLNDLADDDTSSDDGKHKKKSSKASSDDDDSEKNEFLNDMAEEYEEDTPSEGSNDIQDDGESINTTESECDSDESYDRDDSFIADDSETEILPGVEYDLELDAHKSAEKNTRRKRIIENKNSSSEDEVENAKIDRDQKAKKVGTPKVKPVKKTRPEDSTALVQNTEKLSEKSILEKVSTPVSERKLPAIIISEPSLLEKTDKADLGNAKEKSVFEERIRSLVDPKISSTPNTSFTDAVNSPKLNNSARSSSIIIQENLSLTDVQSDIIADKLQQVVKVFCAGIRSSEGNVSMNVSLDFTETAPSAPAPQNNEEVITVDEDEIEVDEKEVVNISQKSMNNLSKIENTSYRNDKIESPSPKKKRRSSHKFDKQRDKPEEIEEPSNSSHCKVFEPLQISSRADSEGEPPKSKKKRRPSLKLAEPFEIFEEQIENSTPKKDMDNEVSSSKAKKRRSSSKFEKQLHTSEENEKHSGSPSKQMKKGNDLDTSKTTKLHTSEENEKHSGSPSKQMKKGKDLDKSTTRKLEPQTSKSVENPSKSSQETDETNEEKEKTSTESEVEDKQKAKKKKRNRKRKTTKSDSNTPDINQIKNKRLKLLEMACEELPLNDLRHKLPSHNEYSESTNTKTNKNRLKRLQSNSNLNMKYARLGNLITDVKNRPKRSIKPSTSVDYSGWLVEEGNVNPSVSNESSAFNYKKISGYDFKNQMLYDPRIKREPTKKLLRNKGYYV